MQIEWRIAPSILAAAVLWAGSASAQAQAPAAPGAAAPAPAAAPAAPAPAAGSQEGVGAWRVECGGDGKIIECRAFQQLLTRENQLVAQVVARLGADKQPQLAMQLPLGISVSEPVVVKVDNGKEEKFSLQTCTNTGCFVTAPLKDPLLASMRTGTQLKLALQDTNKRTLNIDVPLLGFALAFDKATK
jgi:invasion protein IalB